MPALKLSLALAISPFLACTSALTMATAGHAGAPQASQGKAAPPAPLPPPDSCPVTRRPEKPFIPPPPYPINTCKTCFWFGSEKLWLLLDESGTWDWFRRGPDTNRLLTAKLFWFRQWYDYRSGEEINLKITGKRLDGPAPPMDAGVTNGYTDLSFMVVGVYVPEPGCWEVTGNFKGDKLTFVVWVTPDARQPLVPARRFRIPAVNQYDGNS